MHKRHMRNRQAQRRKMFVILIACLIVGVAAVGEDGGEVKDISHMTDEYQTKSASFRRLLHNIRCHFGKKVRLSIQIQRGTKSSVHQTRP